MRRVLILVEGQTEERYANQVLGPHLWSVGVSAVPKIVVTKRAKGVSHFKGGVVSYQQVRGDLRRLLSDTGVAAVSTMLDYYGLPSDFPGRATMPAGMRSARQRAEHVESALAGDIGDARLIPYISMHEFEALLFSEPAAFDGLFPGKNGGARVRAARDEFSTPEEINDGWETHPAARLMKIFPDYDKATVGPITAARIGLEKMRSECPHFNSWVSRLEAL